MNVLALREVPAALPGLIEQMSGLSTEQVDAVIDQIDRMDSDQARSARDQVEAVRRLVGARKESERLRRDLGRLECHIVRRLGLLSATTSLPNHLRTPATYFAAMSGASFLAAIANYQYSATRELTAVRLWRFLTGYQATPNLYPEASVDEHDLDPGDLRRMVEAFVLDLWRRGETIDLRTVDSADPDDPDEANSIADFLRSHAHSETERFGLKRLIYEVVKDGTGEAVPADLINDIDVPEWVTVRGDDGWYLHIPIREATLAQLHWLAELRAEQARVMTTKAHSLSALVSAFERLFVDEGMDIDQRIGDHPNWETSA